MAQNSSVKQKYPLLFKKSPKNPENGGLEGFSRPGSGETSQPETGKPPGFGKKF
jgi:hypothetical protein